jgi:hypothetical protein
VVPHLTDNPLLGSPATGGCDSPKGATVSDDEKDVPVSKIKRAKGDDRPPPSPSSVENILNSDVSRYDYRNRQEEERQDQEDRRQKIANAIDQNEGSAEKPASDPTSPSANTAHSGIDGAVLALSELLFLLFGLPFGEDLYNDRPIPPIHWFYLGVAIFCAIGGPMWPTIRKRWATPNIAASIARSARDARLWVALLLVFFLYGVAPEAYRRASAPVPSIAAGGFSQQQVDQKIAEAVHSVLHPPVPPPPVLGSDEIQFRVDLRKFILNPTAQLWANSFRLVSMTMQNQGSANEPANTLLGKVIQAGVSPKFDTLILSLKDSNIENMDPTKIQALTQDTFSSYNEMQEFVLRYQKITGVQFDQTFLARWVSDDARALAALENLKTYPSATAALRDIPSMWFISSSHKFDPFLKSK